MVPQTGKVARARCIIGPRRGVVRRAAVGPSVLKSQGSPEQFLGLEDVHGPHHVLPADGALAHPLAAFGAGYHVAALQQHAVDDGVHADAAQVFVSRQLSSDTICGGKDEKWVLIINFLLLRAFSWRCPAAGFRLILPVQNTAVLNFQPTCTLLCTCEFS